MSRELDSRWQMVPGTGELIDVGDLAAVADARDRVRALKGELGRFTADLDAVLRAALIADGSRRLELGGEFEVELKPATPRYEDKPIFDALRALGLSEDAMRELFDVKVKGRELEALARRREDVAVIARAHTKRGDPPVSVRRRALRQVGAPTPTVEAIEQSRQLTADEQLAQERGL